jgi:hypothetical protein
MDGTCNTHKGMRNVYTVLVGILQEKRPIHG